MDIYQDGKAYIQETEIREAVTDFAQLALQMHETGVDATSHSAFLLLDRLLLLCQAQHGAIFLTRHKPHLAELQAETASGKVPRIMALREIDEQEASQLFSSFLPVALPTTEEKTLLTSSCWALCHLPTSAPSPAREQEPSQSATPPLLFGDAWFLFGWPSTIDEEWQALLERARLLLPHVVVAAGSALLSLLQAERMQELETVIFAGSVREMELLKAELLATVSHELRSPLASIKGYTATLLRHERRISAQERHEFLLAIQQASDRLQLIVERFLEMSQLETETIKVSPYLIDIARLAQEAIVAAEARVEGQEPEKFLFRLHVRNASGQPTNHVPLVRADPRLLREVLDHLLENAVSYSPEGGLIEVMIRPVPALALLQREPDQIGMAESVDGSQADFTATEGLQDTLEICVRDRGMGIASEHLERIFERFYRVDTSLTRSVSGLGLGLAISKRIVELHHGTIWAESRSGGGSIFCVCLPIPHEQSNR